MKYTKTFALFALQVAASLSFAGPLVKGQLFDSYNIQFTNDEKYLFNSPLYTIVSHVDDGWDEERVSFAGTQRLIEFSKNKMITRFGFISRFGGGRQQFSQNDMTFIADSEAGQHMLSFKRPRGFLIAGGNLSLCLCEALRDLIRGTEKASTAAVQNFFLVSDAVYDDQYYFPRAAGEPKTRPKFTLADLINVPGLNDSTLAKYIQERMIGTGEIFCPDQNYRNHADVNPKEFTFEIFRGSKKIAKYGNRGRHIRLILVPSTQLDATLKQFRLDRFYPIYNLY